MKFVSSSNLQHLRHQLVVSIDKRQLSDIRPGYQSQTSLMNNPSVAIGTSLKPDGRPFSRESKLPARKIQPIRLR
jgi:hypothetical protein